MLEVFHLTSTAKRERLRIGLMVDSLTLPAWAASIVDHIQQSNFARIESVIINASEPPPPAKRAVLPVRLWRILRDKRKRSQFLYGVYSKWDRKRHSPANDPLNPVDCSLKLAACASVSVVPIAKGFTHRFPPNDLETIRAQNLDVILRFGESILQCRGLRVA